MIFLKTNTKIVDLFFVSEILFSDFTGTSDNFVVLVASLSSKITDFPVGKKGSSNEFIALLILNFYINKEIKHSYYF